MGFVKDVLKVGAAVTSPFGLASLALGGKKKKSELPKIPTMISTATSSPTSMIGAPRRNSY